MKAPDKIVAYDEDDFLSLSGLQHLVFCERQWALIHVEQTWVENRLTAEGRVLHKKVDSDRIEVRKGIRVVRGTRIYSARLGLSGRADIVEYRETLDTVGVEITPVEYKRGRPKPHDADRVQICAQAMCLEEMHDDHSEVPATVPAPDYLPGSLIRFAVVQHSDSSNLPSQLP